VRGVVPAAVLCLAWAPGALGANPIQAENALPGTTAWLRGEAQAPAIEGYTSQVSVAPGEAVHLHVSTAPAARYRVELYRLGWYGGAGARLLACVPACGGDRAGAPQPVPVSDPVTGAVRAGWPVTDELPIPLDAPSGYYLAELVLTTGPQQGTAARVVVVVRPPATGRAAILVQVPVNTWQAYNPWGGKSLYDFSSTGGTPANRVSFDRPYARLNQSPFVWELPLVRFLEREGYDVSYATDVDTHHDPAQLQRHRLVVVAGHDEYWTKEIRDAFDSARDSGTNLAFMGANDGYWQVRYEDGERTIVGYKSQADPVGDPALKTVLFRELVPPRFECALMGVQHQGGYRHYREPPQDYTVSAADDPWFAKTGLTAGTTLFNLVGREWDAVPDYRPPECRQPGLVVLFHHDGASGPADAVRYTAPSGARVFSAGSLQFSWALDDFGSGADGHDEPPDQRVQQFVRNALADLTRPAAPASLDVALALDGVSVRIPSLADPRVSEVRIVRHEGQDAFDPAAGEPVCSTRETCLDRPPGHRVYRYAAVARDEWAESVPLLSAAIEVPNSRPTVELSGPTRLRVGRPAVYIVAVADRDGDVPAVRWWVDRVRYLSATRLGLRFETPGRHRIVVRANDGYGGSARAVRAVWVTGRARRGR
jgi:hypothetical protein